MNPLSNTNFSIESNSNPQVLNEPTPSLRDQYGAYILSHRENHPRGRDITTPFIPAGKASSDKSPASETEWDQDRSLRDLFGEYVEGHREAHPLGKDTTTTFIPPVIKDNT